MRNMNCIHPFHSSVCSRLSTSPPLDVRTFRADDTRSISATHQNMSMSCDCCFSESPPAAHTVDGGSKNKAWGGRGVCCLLGGCFREKRLGMETDGYEQNARVCLMHSMTRADV